MPSSRAAEHWTARAQVWLGTLVEIALASSEATEARFAAGFAAIANVHAKMSAHDADSDLARIASHAHRRTVVVDPQTYEVLSLSMALWRETGGAFDVSIASVLARRGLLPSDAATRNAQVGRMGALRLEPHFGVRTTQPMSLDVGGIAKGYAVDRAVDALRAAGASAARVNAGGDLRIFGEREWMPVRVRHPAAPVSTLSLFDVRDAAVATSADYFCTKGSALADARTRRIRRIKGSVTVVAPTCAIADALTKLVALDPVHAPPILARHGAEAFRLEGGHDLRCMATCSVSTAHLRLSQRLAA